MKLKLFFLALVITTTGVYAETATPEYARRTLSNGLEVVVIENHLVPIVTVEICTKNGSFTEPTEYNGLSHLYEHMFFKANGAIPTSEAYLERTHELGIHFNGTTHTEFVNYYFTLPKVNFQPGMKFMADAIMTPKFDQKELEKEREVVLGEFDRNEANPMFPLIRTMDSSVWYKYPSRKQPLGERPTIKTATQEKMLTIQRKYYIPNNSLLIIGGDVTPEEGFAEAEKQLGAWKRGEDPFKADPVPEHPPITKSEIIKVPLNLPIGIIYGEWHGPSVGKDDKSTYAADVFSYICSQPNSKFQQALVESGLTQGIDIAYETQAHVGPIQIFGRAMPNMLPQALKALHDEIQKFGNDDYFTDEELEAAKHILKIGHLYEKESTSNYVHTVSFNWASCGFEYGDHYLENIQKVSRDDIKRYVNTYIKNKPEIMGVGLPEDQMKTLELNAEGVLQ